MSDPGPSTVQSSLPAAAARFGAPVVDIARASAAEVACPPVPPDTCLTRLSRLSRPPWQGSCAVPVVWARRACI